MPEEFNDVSPRADLEAAFEKYDAEAEARGSTPDPEEPVRSTPEEGAEGAAAPDTTESGKPDAQGAAPAVGDKPAAPTKPEGTPAAAPAAGEFKAPISWKAAAKSEWAKIPKAAQEEIARRETETQKIVSESVNARKHWNEFNQTVAPFMPLIRAQNSTPMQAFKNLMTTAAGLTVGSAEQKARIVAEMIGNFGVDIQTLDQVLSQAPQGRQQPPGTSAVEIAIQRQMAPVFDFMNNVKQSQANRQQQMESEADAEVLSFAEKNEFFEEVREDVADLLELNAKRGRKMSLDQAYQIACQQHPEVNKILQQREAQRKANLRNGTVARARNAASSVTGKPNLGGGATETRDNRRDDIVAAWDELSGR